MRARLVSSETLSLVWQRATPGELLPHPQHQSRVYASGSSMFGFLIRQICYELGQGSGTQLSNNLLDYWQHPGGSSPSWTSSDSPSGTGSGCYAPPGTLPMVAQNACSPGLKSGRDGRQGDPFGAALRSGLDGPKRLPLLWTRFVWYDRRSP